MSSRSSRHTQFFNAIDNLVGKQVIVYFCRLRRCVWASVFTSQQRYDQIYRNKSALFWITSIAFWTIFHCKLIDLSELVAEGTGDPVRSGLYLRNTCMNSDWDLVCVLHTTVCAINGGLQHQCYDVTTCRCSAMSRFQRHLSGKSVSGKSVMTSCYM